MRGLDTDLRSPTKIALLIGNVVLLLGLAGFGGYYYWRYRQVMQNPTKYIDFKKYEVSPEEANKQLIEKIAKLITLPEGEQPIISTIKDVDALKKDPFFVNANNGDRLIIYQAAKQAILYREADNKIIKAGPVVLPESAKKKVAILGSEADVQAFEQAITAAFSADTVISTKTIPTVINEGVKVVDLTGANAQLAQKIADQIKGTVVAALPDGEVKPGNSDLVIIGTFAGQ